MFRSILLATMTVVCGIGSCSLGADPAPPGQLPDTTPPGKPHFDSRGAKAGDQLPNLPMWTVDGKPTSLGKAWSGGTTLLLTSSFTCPKSRATYPQAAELAGRVSARGIRVAIVYVIEAHPAGDPSPYTGVEEVTSENRRDQILCRQPKTQGDRLKLANDFAKRFKIEIPIFVDAMDNAAWSMLGGGPNMGVLVDEQGIIIARQGWFDANSMETAIADFIKARPNTADVPKHDGAEGQIDFSLRTLIMEDKIGELTVLLDQQPELEHFLLDERPEHLVQYAALEGSLDIVKLLVKRGADVNCQTAKAATPLHLAAAAGHVETVQFLIDHGAQVNAKAQGHGPTPLQEALFAGNPQVAAALIKAGARPNVFTAAATGDLAELRRDFLADMTLVSRPDGCGRYALTYAAATNHLDAVKLLISLGAREFPSQGEWYFVNATHWAVKNNNLAMARVLLDGGSDPNLFTLAIDCRLPIDFMQTLLDHKADPNCLDGSGLRPLHSAAGHDRQDVMQLLLDGGAPIDAATTGANGLGCGMSYYVGDTALHIAAENRFPLALEFLLKHGAKASVHNQDGETPLHYAVTAAGIDPEIGARMVRLLIEHHADVNAVARDGSRPLDRASPDFFNGGLFTEEKVSPRFASTVELLKKHGAVTSKAIAAKNEK